MSDRNMDPATVDGFGREWETFSHAEEDPASYRAEFEAYFDTFPWDSLVDDAKGFDLGCGTGRWARFVAPRVGELHCVDPAARALAVARKNLADFPNCFFHRASASDLPFADASMDFGYALGVLHHIPEPIAGLRECGAKLKPGAPFLVYIYYALENRPAWYRSLWKITDLFRRIVSHLPFAVRRRVTDVIALLVYWPLARGWALLERVGVDVESLPLSWYRKRPFYAMRNDALDRFGTRLEKRFRLEEIRSMMRKAGFFDLQVSDQAPFWCVLGRRRSK